MVSNMEPSSSTTDEDRWSADESQSLRYHVYLVLINDYWHPYMAGRTRLSQLSPSGYESSSAPAPRRPELLEEPLQTETAEIPDLLREPPPDLPESLQGDISPATATDESTVYQSDRSRESDEQSDCSSDATPRLLYNLRDLYSLEPLPGDLSSAIATDEQMDYQSYCFEELHYFGSSNTLFPPPHELTSDRLESLQADISPATATDESTVYQSDSSQELDVRSDWSSTAILQPLYVLLDLDSLEPLPGDISPAIATDEQMDYLSESDQ